MLGYFRRTACLAAIAVAMAAAAHAQTTGRGYAEGGYTFLDLEGDSGFSADLNTLTLRGGYEFNPTWSVEGDWTFAIEDSDIGVGRTETDVGFDVNGDGDTNDSFTATGDISLDYLFGIYGKGTWPISSGFEIFGRAGLAYAQLDANLVAPNGGTVTSDDDGGGGFAAGAGMNWRIDDRWYVRAEYTWYGLESADINSGSILLGYRF